MVANKSKDKIVQSRQELLAFCNLTKITNRLFSQKKADFQAEALRKLPLRTDLSKKELRHISTECKSAKISLKIN
jgi:hypothetical protein